MNSKSDRQLLQAYVSEESETAFAELVQRHIHIVYSAALRLVVDRHLAEDVTQATFATLARQARSLTDREVLSGWLLVTTRNLGAKTVRTEERRRAREKEAASMQTDPSDPDPVWQQIAPFLDHGLNQLRDKDRDALALRFFERKSAREMGERLGLSEEAAQKRVARALDRLRALLGENGLTVPAAAVAGALSVGAVQSAPIGLAEAVTGAALAGGPVLGAPGLLLLKTMAMKFKVTVLGVVLAGGLATTVLTHLNHTRLAAENAELKQSAELAQKVQEENEQLRSQQTAAAADPVAGLALSRERAEAQKERATLLRLRNQVTSQFRQNRSAADNSALQALRDRLAQQLSWTDVPSDQIKLEPLTGRVVLDSAQNLGAATPEAALTTWLWSLRQQDFEVYANLTTTAEERFALSTNDLALGLDGLTNLTGIAALKLRSQERHGEGQIRLRYDLEYYPGQSQGNQGRGFLQLKQVAGEWKVCGVVWYPRAGTWPK